MSFALFTSKESNLPTVINRNSNDYVDFIMSGLYIEEDTGTKRDMEEQAENILSELYTEIN